MIEREATIVNALGLHARPAAELVKLATRFDADVEILKDTVAVNAKSIMGVMMLAAEYGSTLKIHAIGDDCEAAADAICRLVEDEFGERPEDYEISDPQAEQESV